MLSLLKLQKKPIQYYLRRSQPAASIEPFNGGNAFSLSLVNLNIDFDDDITNLKNTKQNLI